jgi:NAD dependent epimerase/dehydratase family enzyme
VIQHLLARSDLLGPVNVSSPEPVTNAELTKTLGRVLNRPTIMPVPAVALRIAFGEVADALLASTRMRPERLLATGYRFRFPELERALRHVLRRPA